MGCGTPTPCGPTRYESVSGSAKRVLNVPDSGILNETGRSEDAGGDQHLVGRLEDALEVRRKPLNERELFCQAVERNPPDR